MAGKERRDPHHLWVTDKKRLRLPPPICIGPSMLRDTCTGQATQGMVKGQRLPPRWGSNYD